MKDKSIRSYLIYPVCVNIISAVLLFILAIVFKEPILKLFGLNKAARYPIQCILEPFSDTTGILMCDLYLINTTNIDKNARNLLSDLKLENDDETLLNMIDIIIKSNKQGLNIIRIEEDTSFNEDKGMVNIISQKANKEYLLKIHSLKAFAIMRYKIITDYKDDWTPGIQRYNRGLLKRYFNLEYAGDW